MSFSTQIAAAISAARNNSQLDTISREISVAWGGKLIDDDAAGLALEALAARRKALDGNAAPTARKPLHAPRRPPRPRSLDRAASLHRRRAEAATGMLPPHIAAHFTQGEAAALSVVARDVQINGRCVWPVDKIAAIAGCSARTVQRAQRLAERLGFIEIEARPRPGRKSETNVIRVTSAEWAAWLQLHRVTSASSHGKRKDKSILTERHDPASWRFNPAARSFFGSAKGWSGEAPPPRPEARGHDRLEAALARSEALLAGRRPVNLLAR